MHAQSDSESDYASTECETNPEDKVDTIRDLKQSKESLKGASSNTLELSAINAHKLITSKFQIAA